MIRPLNVVCCIAFAAAGAWMYHVKHSVALQDRELREVRRQIEQARERTAILRAEWALLNEPDRLRQVAQRHLALEPMQPQHFARATEFERRLPGAVAFAGVPDMFAAPPEPARAGAAPVMLAGAPVVAPRAGAPAAAAPAARPLDPRAPEAPAPQALAAAVAAQRAAPPPRPAPQPATGLGVVSSAQAAAPRPVAPPAPRPVQPAVHVAPAAPAEPATRTARTAPAETSVASALGGGRALLPPPVAISPAAAATLDAPRGLGPPVAR